jgi:hypothetical protein
MSPQMITHYSRFADQKMLAKSAVRRLEGRTSREQGGEHLSKTVNFRQFCKRQTLAVEQKNADFI